MNLNLVFLFTFILTSLNTQAEDLTCPSDFPKTIVNHNINLNKTQVNNDQVLIEFELLPEFKGHILSDVSLVIGDWEYDKKGELISSPEFTISLNIKDKLKPTARFFKSKSSRAAKLIATYGKGCGYRIESKI